MQSTASAPRRGATQFSQLSLDCSPEVDHDPQPGRALSAADVSDRAQPRDSRAGCDPALADFFAKFTAEQKARRKKCNDIRKQRKCDRELLALKTQAELSRGGEDRQPSVDGSAGLRAGGAR